MITIMPCMGLGKVAAQVTRAASYILDDELDDVEILSIPHLFSGDENAKRKFEQNPIIVIDGCNEKCGSHVCKFCNITPAARVYVIDVMRASQERPGKTRQELEDAGERLAKAVAEQVKEVVQKIKEEGYQKQTAKNIPSDFKEFEYEKKDGYYIPKGMPDPMDYEPITELLDDRDVCVFPSMGINDPEEQVSQVAAYMVNEDLIGEDKAPLLCVPALLACVQEDIDMVEDYPTIILEGSHLMTSSKVYAYKGVVPAVQIRIPEIIDATGLVPQREGTKLNFDGMKLSEEIAKKANDLARRMMNPDYRYDRQKVELYGFTHNNMIDTVLKYKNKEGYWVPEDMPEV